MVLTFELRGQSSKAVNQVCRELGLEKKCVLEKDYGFPLGCLAEVEGFCEAGEGVMNKGKTDGDTGMRTGALPGEMLVFCGMDGTRLDAFLESYRGTGAEPVALKAVMTPHNIWWDAWQLYMELSRERDEIQRQNGAGRK